MRILEWGSGASTLFFARRVKEVVTIEHDPEWHAQVEAMLAERLITNCRCMLVPPEPVAALDDRGGDVGRYVSQRAEYHGLQFRRYVHAAEALAEALFDVVVVDGRARTACLDLAPRLLAANGAVVFDNSDRSRYQEALDSFGRRTDWTIRVFRGPVPGRRAAVGGQTTVFVKLRHYA